MKSLASILLILTIIYTTIGVRVNAHHCEITNITNYSVFEVEDCCPKEKNSCPLHQQKNDCCSDQINLVHLGQDIHFYPDAITPNQLLVGFLFTNYSYKSPSTKGIQLKEVKGRAPPILYQQENRQALHQVYII